ncbi:choice-of-anchor Q domain-containing protein [Flavilitoribacter nigricans]|nr:right-handed parallel beta-helix repeat-containing protein [Flavilitoribacter nigricans]
MKIKELILLLVGLAGSTGLHATNYYVANGGSNANSGLSAAEAFITIQHAVGLIAAGDTVFVADGTYAGFDVRDVSGTPAAPIVFRATGTQALINQSGPIRNDGINVENADHIVIDGFICNNMPGNGNGIRVVLGDHCVVRNNSCDNNAERGIFTAFTDDILIEFNTCTNSIDEHGIYVSNSSDRPIIRYNTCYGNNNIGIHMNGDLSAGGDGIISDAQVYGNIIFDNNLAAGINMDGVENPVVYNNLIYNNHSAQGIALFQQDGAIPSRGAKIYNNTIIVPDDGRWGILVKAGSNVGTEIYNNIIINQHAWRGCIAAENIEQFSSDYNLLNDKLSATGDGSTVPLSEWQGLGLDEHSLLVDDPENVFADPGGQDFQLKAGSPAIDRGTDAVQSVVAIDLSGNARPQGAAFDIGAYEFPATVGTQHPLAGHLRVFPNPARKSFTLETDADLGPVRLLLLRDATGRPVRAYSFFKRQYDLDGLEAGFYLLEIRTDHEQPILRKILVQ